MFSVAPNVLMRQFASKSGNVLGGNDLPTQSLARVIQDGVRLLQRCHTDVSVCRNPILQGHDVYHGQAILFEIAAFGAKCRKPPPARNVEAAHL